MFNEIVVVDSVFDFVPTLNHVCVESTEFSTLDLRFDSEVGLNKSPSKHLRNVVLPLPVDQTIFIL